MRFSGLRAFASTLGLLLIGLAAYKLTVAVQQLVADGTLMILDPRPRVSRKGGPDAYPVPWRDAWPYLAGWLTFVVSGSLMVAAAWRGKPGLFLLSLPVAYLGFVLCAAALVLSSWAGVALFIGVCLAGVAFVVMLLHFQERLSRWKLLRGLPRPTAVLKK